MILLLDVFADLAHHLQLHIEADRLVLLGEFDLVEDGHHKGGDL